MTKIVALVPMRHHSQRITGKNYRPLGDKPLFHYIIETLLDVPELAEIARIQGLAIGGDGHSGFAQAVRTFARNGQDRLDVSFGQRDEDNLLLLALVVQELGS